MEKLKVSLVIEILGRPQEYVKEALKNLVNKMISDKGVRLISSDFHDPIEVKDSKNLYTAFSEVQLELDSLSNYFAIIFAYMPSHIEIISPERISLTNSELNELANALAQRLHNYDAVAKNLIGERDILLKKLQEIAPNLFKQGQKPDIKSNVQSKSTNKESKVSTKAKSKTNKKNLKGI